MPPFDREGALKRAGKALRQGRIDAAVAEYERITEADPRDWKSAQALGDLYVRAGQAERARAQYARTGDHLAAQGLADEALTLFRACLRLRPDDGYAMARIRDLSSGSRPAGAAGDPALPADPAEASVPEELADEDGWDGADEQSPWFAMAEVALLDGRLDEVHRAVAEALQFDPRSKGAALAMAYRAADESPDAGYAVIDAIVDRAIGENDYAAAAAALQEFVTRIPHHLAALMRLVDVAMDGGLESAMYEGQAQLADAYLNAGRGLEARIVSEDLVAREPWNRANLERFRKALALLGEPDPDAVIAGRLAGESPFLATDVLDFARQGDDDEGLDLFEAPAAVPAVIAAAATDAAERTGGTPTEEEAAASYRLAVAGRALGLVDEAVAALEAASASTRLRLGAAVWLGAIHRARGRTAAAAEWLDRAARWAPPATDIGRAVRYDLGDVLEAVGDRDRALAVFTGLDAEQPGYRDVPDRIHRLLDPEPRG